MFVDHFTGNVSIASGSVWEPGGAERCLSAPPASSLHFIYCFYNNKFILLRKPDYCGPIFSLLEEPCIKDALTQSDLL